MKATAMAVILLAVALAAACGRGDDAPEASPLMFDSDSGNFFFVDASGNRAIYEREGNSLIVEPDTDIEELARAYCKAESETLQPARFAGVSLALAEGIPSFVETVERVCDR